MTARSFPLLVGTLVASLAGSGCYDVSGWNGDTPSMLPGQDCMSCHSANGLAAQRPWTLAGTVYSDPKAGADAGVLDAEILVSDDAGVQLTLLTDSTGNFYTSETLTPPVHVEVQWGSHRMRMVEPPPNTAAGGGVSISCNKCHTSPPPAVAPVADFSPAPGRVFIPTDTDGGAIP